MAIATQMRSACGTNLSTFVALKRDSSPYEGRAPTKGASLLPLDGFAAREIYETTATRAHYAKLTKVPGHRFAQLPRAHTL